MRTLTLRAQFLLVLLAIIALSTTMVGVLAYRTSSRMVQDDAIRTTGLAADAREQALDRELHNQHDRAQSFLEAAVLGCTEWDRPNETCLKAELARFMREEHARFGVVRHPKIPEIKVGEDWPETPEPPPFAPGQVMAAQSYHGASFFFLRANMPDGSSIGLRLPPMHIEPIFNATGLGHSGESFLVTANGTTLTGPHRSMQINTPSMQDCLKGNSGEVIAPDPQGRSVIMGYRPTPQIGGGCIMAHMEVAEAFAPVVTLRNRIASASMLLAAIAIVLGLLFSDYLRKAIQVLEVGTRAIDSGDLKLDIPRGAPREFHDFARLLRSISRSLRERSRTLSVLNERLQRAHEAGRIASWEWDANTDEIVWSEKAGEIYGHPDGDFAPNRNELFTLIDPEDREHVAKEVTAALTSGELQTEYRMISGDGSTRWISARGQTFYNDGKPVRMVGTSLDVTERKLAEEALRKTEKLAAAGRLAATIAHEVNNPLEAVTNLLYLAKAESSLESTHTLIGMAEQELDRVIQLTKQTLGFYRETAAPHVLQLSPIVESVAELFRRRARQKGVTLDVEVLDDAQIVASAGEIKQVVSNFLSNAVDACSRDGQIKVRLRKTGERVLLAFADNGSGVAAENRTKIFEPFFTTKRDVGTGLGLWVSREIIEKHSGTIRMFSSTHPDRSGTVFVISFPSAAKGASVSA